MTTQAGIEVKAPWADLVEETRVLMPARGRRLVLLMVAALLGGLAGLISSEAVAATAGVPLVVALSLFAGISAMWSP